MYMYSTLFIEVEQWPKKLSILKIARKAIGKKLRGHFKFCPYHWPQKDFRG